MEPQTVRGSEAQRTQGARLPDSWVAITKQPQPDGTEHLTLLSVLRVEGVIGAHGRVDRFYARFGELENDVDVFSAFVPIGNPMRETKKTVAGTSRSSVATTRQKAAKLRKRDRQRLSRLLKAEFWKLSVKVHVKSSFVTQSEEGAVLEHHKARVLKVIGAWNAEFRPSQLKGVAPRRLSDLFPTTSSGPASYGTTATILQLTKFPPRMDTTPTPTFELPPKLPTDLVLGNVMVGTREADPVGLPLEALWRNVAIFSVDPAQRTRILTRILSQAQQHGQACLILAASGDASITKPGWGVLQPGSNFQLAPLCPEGLSTEHYTDLFLRALNLFCELPQDQVGELAGLLLRLYEEMGAQISLQTLHQALSGELSEEESPSLYFETYGLRSVAALLQPLLHGLAVAAVSGDPETSTMELLDAQLARGKPVILDLSKHFTPAFKKFFMALIASKLLAFRQAQLNQGRSVQGLVLVLEDADFFLRKGDWRTNQRLDNFLPVLVELGRVQVGLIALGTTPEVLWEPAWGLISRNLVLSQLSPNAARFIEKYLDLDDQKFDRTKRKFLQRLGENDLILVKRYDLVEPFLCKLDTKDLEFEEVGVEQPTLVPVEAPLPPQEDRDLLAQAYNLEQLFKAQSTHVVAILRVLESMGRAVPQLGLITMLKGDEGKELLPREALQELLARLEEAGLVKRVTSRGIPADMDVEITPVGRLFLQKHLTSTQPPLPQDVPSESLEAEVPSPALEFEEPLPAEVSAAEQEEALTELPKPAKTALETEVEPAQLGSRTRTLAKDWIAAKQLFWEEKPTAWEAMKTAILEALSDLYAAERHHPPRDAGDLLNWIRRNPDIDSYLYPELEEALLTQGTGLFEPDVFTPDILQMFEDLFAVGSGYPRVVHRATEAETLARTQPIDAAKAAAALVTELVSVLVNLPRPSKNEALGWLLEAFSLTGVFLPHKQRWQELQTIGRQAQRADKAPKELEERSAKALENFHVVVKDLETALFDLDDSTAAEVRRTYSQLVRGDMEKSLEPPDIGSRSTPEDDTAISDLEEDEILSDLLAVGSEELVLIDCGRFIREGLAHLLQTTMDQINLDQATRLLALLLEAPHLKLPFAKRTKRVLDALSFLIETGELPAEDIAQLAQTAQKFAQAMKTYTPDNEVKVQLKKLFERAKEPWN